MNQCCPLVDRIEPLETRSGQPVSDAHMHRGLVRGYVEEGGNQRLMFWHRNGRLTPLAETELDLRRVPL